MRIDRFSNVLGLGLIWFALAGCGSGAVFEAARDLPSYQWSKDSLMVFAFEVADVNPPYRLAYHLRNTASYGSDRFYVKYVLSGPDGKVLASEMKPTLLFDATTGEPLGRGLGDLFEHEVILLPNYKFPKPGRYSISLQQFMRDDVLSGVASVGVRLTKANE
jgi:gliding motility-associated lipoprotein GldH